jgi:hypothetical protein
LPAETLHTQNIFNPFLDGAKTERELLKKSYHQVNLSGPTINVHYENLQGCAASPVRSPFLWDMAPRHWVTGSRRFETAWWDHLQVSHVPTKNDTDNDNVTASVGNIRVVIKLFNAFKYYNTLHYCYCYDVLRGVRFYNHLYLQPAQPNAQENA